MMYNSKMEALLGKAERITRERGKVLSLEAKIQQKKEAEEKAKLEEFYRKFFSDLPLETKIEILEALQNKDEKRYREITEPIILWKTIREFN